MTDFYTDTIGIQAQSNPDLFAFTVSDSSALARMATLPAPARSVAFTAGPTTAIYTWSETEYRDDGGVFLRPRDRNAIPGRWVLAAVGVSGEPDYYDNSAGIGAQSDPSLFSFQVASADVLLSIPTFPVPARSVTYITGGTLFSKDLYVWSDFETREQGLDLPRPRDRNGMPGRWVRVVAAAEEPNAEETLITIFGANALELLDGDVDTDVGGNWIGQVAGSVFAPNAAPVYNATLLDGQGAFTYVRTSSQRHDNATLDLAAPGTTPFFELVVARPTAWNSGATLIGSSNATSSGRIHQGGVTPEFQMNNGVSVNTNNAGVLNTWVVVVAEFTNSTSDRLIVGANIVTGANAGANDPAAGRQIGGTAGTSHINANVALVLWGTIGASYAAQLASAFSYLNTRYPTVVTP